MSEKTAIEGNEKYFFSQDDSCHWYMIPANKRKRWEEIQNMNPEEPDTWDAYEEFSKYRTNGGISHIEFTVDNNQNKVKP